MFKRRRTNEEMKAMKKVDHHTRCHDCGMFLIKNLWVRKDHPKMMHALCSCCFDNYDDPMCL